MHPADILLGDSPAMVALREQVTRLLQSRSDEPILIQGETGTGKSTLAHGMHRLSARGDGPFVYCNMSPLPIELMEAVLFGVAPGCFCDGKGRPGLFQDVHGGTIYVAAIDRHARARAVQASEGPRRQEGEPRRYHPIRGSRCLAHRRGEPLPPAQSIPPPESLRPVSPQHAPDVAASRAG